MKNCLNCEEEIHPLRAKIPNVTLCLSCQKEAEESGTFVRHSMEIGQDISGWQFEGVRTNLVKGGLKEKL